MCVSQAYLKRPKQSTEMKGQGTELQVVFKGPVQSGLLTILGMDQDLDRSRLFLKWSRLRLDQFGLVQIGPNQSIDRSRLVHSVDWSRLV